MIRKALITDLPAIVDIYNQAIISRCCTGDTFCFSADERLPWFMEHNTPRTPVFVFEMEQRVIAYCSISPYRPGRKAFENIGEISYYVDFNYHKKGVGSQLLKHLLMEAAITDYSHLLAILLECNIGSISLLEKFGFKKWGALPNIAHIDNNYYSHLYYGLAII